MTAQPSGELVAAITGRLPQARWFAGKGQGIGAVSLVDAISLPDATTLAIVEVTSAGASSRYVIPVDASGADRAATPAFARWLIDTVWNGTAHAGGQGRAVGHAVGERSRLSPGSPDVAIMGPDASNTSLRVTVGAAAFAVKLMRRCRPGIQPEVEVGAFVAEQTSWRGTPRLCGWLGYEPADGGPATTLATVHEFAAGCDAAWDRMLGLVRAEGSVSPRLLTIVDTLAAVTAEMHAALASRPDVDAFAPAIPTAADRHAQVRGLAAHADAVCRLIAEPSRTVAAEIATRLKAVAARRDEVVSRLAAVADLDSGATSIRVHGDYHLGQVLLTPDNRPLVIDFEGEPSRSLDERRTKTSACKDVAGMCRSLDYLLRCAARDGGSPYAAADAADLQRRYVAGYASRVSGRSWWPARPADAEALLAAYVLDKALYELAYELQNRPDWIEVPLGAVEAI